MRNTPTPNPPPSGDGPYRAFFTRNGKRYYAKDYGYRSWKFRGPLKKKASNPK